MASAAASVAGSSETLVTQIEPWRGLDRARLNLSRLTPDGSRDGSSLDRLREQGRAVSVPIDGSLLLSHNLGTATVFVRNGNVFQSDCQREDEVIVFLVVQSMSVVPCEWRLRRVLSANRAAK
jgi:hypothetical protein